MAKIRRIGKPLGLWKCEICNQSFPSTSPRFIAEVIKEKYIDLDKVAFIETWIAGIICFTFSNSRL